MEKLVTSNYFLCKSAKEAYKTYIRAYASHSLKEAFDVEKLDLKKVAKCFGFEVPPFVDLSMSKTHLFFTFFPSEPHFLFP